MAAVLETVGWLLVITALFVLGVGALTFSAAPYSIFVFCGIATGIAVGGLALTGIAFSLRKLEAIRAEAEKQTKVLDRIATQIAK